jgi:hypothetical protein
VHGERAEQEQHDQGEDGDADGEQHGEVIRWGAR